MRRREIDVRALFLATIKRNQRDLFATIADRGSSCRDELALTSSINAVPRIFNASLDLYDNARDIYTEKLDEASTYNSANIHAGNIFVTRARPSTFGPK